MGVKINGVEVHFGYEPTPPKQEKYVDELLAATQTSPEYSDFRFLFKGDGAGKLSVPYASVITFVGNVFDEEAQKTGDCTSHGARNAADISRAVEIHINKEPEDFIARGCTEGIYGYRGFSGAGMNPGKATEFLIKYGVLLRKNYPFADLSNYNPNFGIGLGRSGPPKELLAVAGEHPCKYFLRIRTVEDARDALNNGFGIHCGSNYGNNGVRNSKGICSWNNSWNHDMSWGAADDTGDDLLFMVINSWGPKWCRGGKPEWNVPFPDGSFLIPSRDAKRMIEQGECWAVGNVLGWPKQKLPDYGFSWA